MPLYDAIIITKIYLEHIISLIPPAHMLAHNLSHIQGSQKNKLKKLPHIFNFSFIISIY